MAAAALIISMVALLLSLLIAIAVSFMIKI